MAKSTYTHDVVATIGEYKDRHSGEMKKRYTAIGKGFTDDQGRISFKLDCIPVGPEWSGWASLYPAKDREPQREALASQQPADRQHHEQAKANAFAPSADDEEDIPF